MMATATVACPVCEGRSRHYADVDGVPYLRCERCRTIHITPEALDEIDAGRPLLRDYGQDYWEMELRAARERADGTSLCRAGEALLYCRREVAHFLDLGAGPGYLLGNLLGTLDPEGRVFEAVERFPPAEHLRHANYHEGSIADLAAAGRQFDAGVCIEVVEHLTPRMLRELVRELARVSKPDSYWLFNTGLDLYVEKEDPRYLDPYQRGHIMSWSIEGLRRLFEPAGFRIQPLPGKSFAFAAEFKPTQDTPYDQRIYSPLAGNAALLARNPLLHVAAFESARSYYYFEGYLERTAWATRLDGELRSLKRRS